MVHSGLSLSRPLLCTRQHVTALRFQTAVLIRPNATVASSARVPCAGPLLDLLSPTLRGEAAHHVVGARMRNVNFLQCDDSETEQRAFTTAIAQQLKLRIYGQGERICSVDEPALELFVIVKVTFNTTIHSSSDGVCRRLPRPAATFAVAVRASSSSPPRRIARITTAPPLHRSHISLVPRLAFDRGRRRRRRRDDGARVSHRGALRFSHRA